MKEFKQDKDFDSFLVEIINSKVGEVYECQHQPNVIQAVQINEDFKAHTQEGIMNGKAGDYLVMSPTGGLWPVEKDFFEENYYKLHRLDPPIQF